MKQFHYLILCLAIGACVQISGAAEDGLTTFTLQTRQGKKYEQARVLGFDSDGIRFRGGKNVQDSTVKTELTRKFDRCDSLKAPSQQPLSQFIKDQFIADRDFSSGLLNGCSRWHRLQQCGQTGDNQRRSAVPLIQATDG